MTFWKEEKTREVVLSQWRTYQVVLAAWIIGLFVLPLLWGWDMSLLSFLEVLAIAGLPPLLFFEIYRRGLNRELNENLCKWIWQK